MALMDAMTALLTRVSPARLMEPGPSGRDLEMILAAGASAPDHGRLRPWRFILIDGEARQRFGEVLVKSLVHREPTAPPQKLDAERKKALRAPMIIAAVASVQEHPSVPEIEQVIAVGAAVQNILLAAHALGFGGFWRTGPAAYDASVREALGIGLQEQLVGFLYVGSVGAPGKPREINLSERVTRWPAAI